MRSSGRRRARPPAWHVDESYLTGEPFSIAKAPGAALLSGSINGDSALDVRAIRTAADFCDARITGVMQSTRQQPLRSA